METIHQHTLPQAPRPTNCLVGSHPNTIEMQVLTESFNRGWLIDLVYTQVSANRPHQTSPNVPLYRSQEGALPFQASKQRLQPRCTERFRVRPKSTNCLLGEFVKFRDRD